MSRGDALLDPLEPSPHDSLEKALDKLLSANLLNQLTTYEILSNYIIKLIKLFRNNKDETSVNISKFCNFTESSLKNLQVRLSRKAFDLCLGKLHFWIRKWSSSDLLNIVFRALGSILYGAGSMSDFHRDDLLLKPDSLLSNYLSETTDNDIKRLAYQCLANLSIRLDRGIIHEDLQHTIFDFLLNALMREKRAHDDVISYLRLVVICFEGLTSLAQYNKTKFSSSLGQVFAVARYYMVLGLPGFYDLPQKCFEPLKNTSIMSKMGSGSSQQTAFNLALFRAQKKKPEFYPDYSDSEDETRNEGTPEFLANGGHDSLKTSFTIDRKEILGSHDSQFSMICETKENFGSRDRSVGQVGNVVSKMAGICKKVRSVALKALHEVLKTAPPKLSFGYWWNFIPDGNTTDLVPSAQPFFFLLLKDKNVKSRTEALNCLSQFLIVARPYILAAADDRHDPKAYTPYSYTLATSIKELNRLIVQITSSDYGFVTLPIALKAFAELVLSTPYHKLRFGLLTRIVRHLINFLNSSHCPTRIEAFRCLTSVVQIDPPLAEIYELFKTPTPPPRARLMTEECTDTPDSYRYVLSGAHTPLVNCGLYGAMSVSEPLSNSSRGSFSSSRQNLAAISSSDHFAQDENAFKKLMVSGGPVKCWSLAVVEDVVLNGHPITRESANPDQENLKISALNFVAALSQHYLRILAGSLTELWQLLQRGLQQDHSSEGVCTGSVEIRLASLKTITQIARSMCRATSSNQAAAVDKNQYLQFQSRLLTEQLIPLLASSCKSQLKALTCDCISALAPEVYEQICEQTHSGEDKMTKCIDLVLDYSLEGDPQVSPAALKTLGSYVQCLPSLADDYTFMRNVADTVIKLTSSSNRYVRSRSAWVLANLCDNFTSLSDRDPNFLANLTPNVFMQCLKATLLQAEDQDRSKYNAVRGICGLLSCIKAPLTETEEVNHIINTCFDLLTKLITGPTLSKVQWNTCISAGKIFKNKFLCQTNSTKMVQNLISALLQAVQNCSNYRVKINALTSLKHINDRQTFTAKLLYQSSSICLQTLKNTENLTDFDQYRHQAELQESLCLFMCHVIKLMNNADFAEVSMLFNSLLSEAITQSFRNCALKTEHETVFQQVEMKLQDFEPKNQVLISLIAQSRKSDSFTTDSKVFHFVPHHVFNTN